MGHLAWLGVGTYLLTAAVSQAAPGASAPPAAATNSSAPALPPPPPAPPAASPPSAPPSAAPAPPNAPPSSPPPNTAPPNATPPAPAPGGASPPNAAPLPPPPAAPAGYQQPYPGYAPYPPPGYGYYYPPQQQREKVRFAPDAALSSSPFLDVLVASISWQNRVSQFLNVGFQGGVYLAHRVRLSANVILPTSDVRDEYSPPYDYSPGSTGYYLQQPAKRVSLFYGGTLGIVVVSTPTFVMAPGLAFSRTDVSDYGSSLAVALPFEWVTGNGLRLGLEFDAGRAFGGVYHTQCYSSSGGTSCGPPLTPDRPSGTSILLQFQLGFGFNHPEPLPAENSSPAAWPAAPGAAPPAAAPNAGAAPPPS